MGLSFGFDGCPTPLDNADNGLTTLMDVDVLVRMPTPLAPASPARSGLARCNMRRARPPRTGKQAGHASIKAPQSGFQKVKAGPVKWLAAHGNTASPSAERPHSTSCGRALPACGSNLPAAAAEGGPKRCVLWRRRKRHRGDAGCDVQPGGSFDAERLQPDRVCVPADQRIGPEPNPHRRAGSGAAVAAGEIARLQLRRWREHSPD